MLGGGGMAMWTSTPAAAVLALIGIDDPRIPISAIA
jgi:hypothetical protein